MKKFVYVLCAVLAIAFTASCASCSKDGDQFGIAYSLQSDGQVDGLVRVAFPNGEAGLKGDASYDFSWTNQLKLFADNADAMSLEQALVSKDENMLKAANYVNDWLESAFQIVEADGHYDIYIKGYVEETFTHLKFEVDKHFTN